MADVDAILEKARKRTKQAGQSTRVGDPPPSTDPRANAPVIGDVEKGPDISLAETAGRGLATGATAGFSDEVAGIGASLGAEMGPQGERWADSMRAFNRKLIAAREKGDQAEMARLFREEYPPNPMAEVYREARDERRAEDKAAADANPKTSFVSTVAGSVPGALINPIGGLGGAMAHGGLFGLGASEEEDAAGLAGDVGTGSLFGAGGYLGGKVAGAVGQKVLEKAGDVGSKMAAGEGLLPKAAQAAAEAGRKTAAKVSYPEAAAVGALGGGVPGAAGALAGRAGADISRRLPALTTGLGQRMMSLGRQPHGELSPLALFSQRTATPSAPATGSAPVLQPLASAAQETGGAIAPSGLSLARAPRAVPAFTGTAAPSTMTGPATASPVPAVTPPPRTPSVPNDRLHPRIGTGIDAEPLTVTGEGMPPPGPILLDDILQGTRPGRAPAFTGTAQGRAPRPGEATSPGRPSAMPPQPAPSLAPPAAPTGSQYAGDVDFEALARQMAAQPGMRSAVLGGLEPSPEAAQMLRMLGQQPSPSAVPFRQPVPQGQPRAPAPAPALSGGAGLPPSAQRMYQMIQQFPGQNHYALAMATGLTPNQARAVIQSLEFQGLVLPGRGGGYVAGR